MRTVSRRAAQLLPPFMRCEPRPITVRELRQRCDDVVDAARARIPNRPARERREAGAEYDAGVQQVGVGDDARWADSEYGPLFVHAPSLRLGAWHFTGGTEA